MNVSENSTNSLMSELAEVCHDNPQQSVPRLSLPNGGIVDLTKMSPFSLTPLYNRVHSSAFNMFSLAMTEVNLSNKQSHMHIYDSQELVPWLYNNENIERQEFHDPNTNTLLNEVLICCYDLSSPNINDSKQPVVISESVKLHDRNGVIGSLLLLINKEEGSSALRDSALCALVYVVFAQAEAAKWSGPGTLVALESKLSLVNNLYNRLKTESNLPFEKLHKHACRLLFKLVNSPQSDLHVMFKVSLSFNMEECALFTMGIDRLLASREQYTGLN